MSVSELDGVPDRRQGRRRRRRWSKDEKRRIVAEADAPGASVSVVARRYDLNANMLFTWRRQLGLVGVPSTDAAVTFVPAQLAGAAELAPAAAPAAPVVTVTGRMEIVLAQGDRIVAGSDVDAAALARVLKALSRR